MEYPLHMRHVAFAHEVANKNKFPLLKVALEDIFLDVGDDSWKIQSWPLSDSASYSRALKINHFSPSDFGVRLGCIPLRKKTSGWYMNETAWTTWIRQSYKHVAVSSLLANVPVLSEHTHQLGTHLVLTPQLDSAAECDDQIWDIPVAMMSQAHDHERRHSTMQVLHTIGFRNVTIAQTIKWTDMDVERMCADGVLSPSLFRRMQRQDDTDETGYLKYAANALSQIQRIRAAADAGEPVIIMEDDLMAGASAKVVRDNLCGALSDLPPTADMVYLEYCFEGCADLLYNQRYPRIARAWRPACSAAILFTVKGARRVADLCLPVFDVIDRMYPALVSSRWVEAYVMVQSPFFQDQIFASNWNRNENYDTKALQLSKRPYHQPATSAPLCLEVQRDVSGGGELVTRSFEFLFSDRRQVGVVLPNTDVKSLLMMLEGVDSDGLTELCQYRGLGSDEGMNNDDLMNVWLRFALPDTWNDVLGRIPRAQIVLSTRLVVKDRPSSYSSSYVEVGTWMTERPCGTSMCANSCGTLLRIAPHSECFGLRHDDICELEVSLVASDGTILNGLPMGLYFVEWRKGGA